MKLPTLNVDVAVNTKTMQKGIAEANKNLEKVGKKGLSLAGGGAGKLGSLAELGGGFGMGAIGAGGIAVAAMAPFKIASGYLDMLSESAKRGREAMDEFAQGKAMTGGIDLGAASKLAAAGEKSTVKTGGIIDTFMAGMMNEQGQVTGLAGLLKDWGELTVDGTKALAAALGGVLGGKDAYEIEQMADMATTRSAGGAQAYMTPDQINYTAAQAERYRKAQREQNT